MTGTPESGSSRYEIRQAEEGPFIHCREAPSVSVRLDRALAFSESDALKLGERVILLDGVGQFAPTIDGKRQLYNLDHHANCLRSFTLASCEQALVVVVKGLALDKGDWTIYANEPDLDTLIAMWILLNFRRIPGLPRGARDILLPMVRLEGAIDSNGAEVAEYCGLPTSALAAARSNVEALFEKEQQIKQAGDWAQLDPLEFAVEMLQEIDAFIYGPGGIGELAKVEHEYGHVDIGDDWVAVVCRDGSGIYEVERRLRQVWGDRLGLIVLEREPGQYTIRRVASLSAIDLGRAYAHLNLVDRAVDGHPPEKRWGGADEIGGSPRPQGSQLSPEQIKEALRQAYRSTGLAERGQSAWRGLIRSALVMCSGIATASLTLAALPATQPAVELFLIPFACASGAALCSAIFLYRLSAGRPWLFGWRRPAGWDWWPAALAVPFAGLIAVPWSPPLESIVWGSTTALWVAASCAAVAIAAELWFRGWVHGLFLMLGPVQSVGSRWMLSPAIRWSALLYAAQITALAPLGLVPGLQGWSDPALIGVALAALVAGVLLGIVRERSLSLWPGVIAQYVALLAAILGGEVALAWSSWS